MSTTPSDWVTRRATLDRWEAVTEIVGHGADAICTVTVSGHCTRKRGRLWTVSEVLPARHNQYGAADFITHITLVCLAERPFTQAQVDNALVGGRTGNEDPTLF